MPGLYCVAANLLYPVHRYIHVHKVASQVCYFDGSGCLSRACAKLLDKNWAQKGKLAGCAVVFEEDVDDCDIEEDEDGKGQKESE